MHRVEQARKAHRRSRAIDGGAEAIGLLAGTSKRAAARIGLPASDVEVQWWAVRWHTWESTTRPEPEGPDLADVRSLASATFAAMLPDELGVWFDLTRRPDGLLGVLPSPTTEIPSLVRDNLPAVEAAPVLSEDVRAQWASALTGQARLLPAGFDEIEILLQRWVADTARLLTGRPLHDAQPTVPRMVFQAHPARPSCGS